MQTKEGQGQGLGLSGEIEVESSAQASATADYSDWPSFADDEDIMEQRSKIDAMEAEKIPFVGQKLLDSETRCCVGCPVALCQKLLTISQSFIVVEASNNACFYKFTPWKEGLSSLAAEYQSGSPILLQKIKILEEKYAAIRRTRGDGNCFFRGFMFSYLEHILETQDKAEVERIKNNVEECRRTLQGLGYVDFTFEDFFSLFIEQLDSVLQGDETSISPEELLHRSQDPSVSDYVVMFFRFVTAGEIRKRTEFFEPFILGLANTTVEQFCKSSVEPMGEESDHVHIIAVSDALGVPIRVVYLDRSSCDNGVININHHDFIPSTSSGSSENPPSPFMTLLYRPGHYDILYQK